MKLIFEGKLYGEQPSDHNFWQVFRESNNGIKLAQNKFSSKWAQDNVKLLLSQTKEPFNKPVVIKAKVTVRSPKLISNLVDGLVAVISRGHLVSERQICDVQVKRIVLEGEDTLGDPCDTEYEVWSI